MGEASDDAEDCGRAIGRFSLDERQSPMRMTTRAIMRTAQLIFCLKLADGHYRCEENVEAFRTKILVVHSKTRLVFGRVVFGRSLIGSAL